MRDKTNIVLEFKKEKYLAFIRVKKFIDGALAPHCLDLDLNDRKTRHSF